VRYIGASNYSGSRLAEALETSRKNNLTSYVSLQPHYNLVEREKFETDLLPVVQKYQLGVIPYFSLAAGFLTGKYRSKQDAEKAARGAMVQKYMNDNGFGVIAALNMVANAKGSTPARVALAWLISQPGVTAPIASATNDKQLIDLAEAAKLKLIAGPSTSSMTQARERPWPDTITSVGHGQIRHGIMPACVPLCSWPPFSPASRLFLHCLRPQPTTIPLRLQMATFSLTASPTRSFRARCTIRVFRVPTGAIVSAKHVRWA
jgi:hypothetical protein